MNVFLDLEETVINNWTEGMLLNSSRVREWLQDLNIKQVRLFSFAIWNEKDQFRFEKEFKPVLRRALDVGFIDCPSVEDFIKADLKVTGVLWDNLHEFAVIRGKQDAFRSWCKLHFDGQHNVLLDDTVTNGIWHNKDTNLKLEFINITAI